MRFSEFPCNVGLILNNKSSTSLGEDGDLAKEKKVLAEEQRKEKQRSRVLRRDKGF